MACGLAAWGRAARVRVGWRRAARAVAEEVAERSRGSAGGAEQQRPRHEALGLRFDDQVDVSKRTKDKKERSVQDGAYFFDMFDPQFSTSKGPPVIPEVGPGR